MSNYARIINNIAVDVTDDPASRFHPAVASEFESVPSEVEQGWILADDGTWSAPPPPPAPEEPEPQRPKVGPTEFKLLWSIQERLKLKELRPNDPIIDDFFEIIEDPRLTEVNLGLASTADSVNYCLSQLVSAGVITEADVPVRQDEILSGQLL